MSGSYIPAEQKWNPKELTMNDRMVLRNHANERTGFIGGNYKPNATNGIEQAASDLTLP